jgi:hypothetical protein
MLALSTIYPSIDWQPWKFANVTRDFWTNLENQRKFLDWIAEKMDLHHQASAIATLSDDNIISRMIGIA